MGRPFGRDAAAALAYLRAMTIPDPHAIPESEQDVHEYVTAADHAWDSGDTVLAGALYDSIATSHYAHAAQQSHAYYRAGMIAIQDGDTDRALVALNASHEPGAADLAKSLTNATHDDPTPSPDTVPQSQEQWNAWFAAGEAAAAANNYELAMGLFMAAAQATGVAAPNQIAYAEINTGVSASKLGHNDTALQWIEFGLPKLTDDEPIVATARDMIKKLGGAHEGASDQSPVAVQLAAGIEAYENGDAHGARAALEAVLHMDGPDDVKGRAHYYLGTMEYQAHQYAAARDHIDAAVHAASEPERSWAEAALQWRWDEHPAEQ
jgi:tetratricopeptide (TPR) repeat protein